MDNHLNDLDLVLEGESRRKERVDGILKLLSGLEQDVGGGGGNSNKLDVEVEVNGISAISVLSSVALKWFLSVMSVMS